MCKLRYREKAICGFLITIKTRTKLYLLRMAWSGALRQMQLNPGKLENADLDLRYFVPDRIEEVSGSMIKSNGYDYVDTEDGEPGPLMGIWLETKNTCENWHMVRGLLQREKSMGNGFIVVGSDIFLKRIPMIWRMVSLFFPSNNFSLENRIHRDFSKGGNYICQGCGLRTFW